MSENQESFTKRDLLLPLFEAVYADRPLIIELFRQEIGPEEFDRQVQEIMDGKTAPGIFRS